MIIALLPNSGNKESEKLIFELISLLRSENIQLCTDDANYSKFKLHPISFYNPEDIEIIITMGGDGTILRIANYYSHLKNAAILGINLGHLGFMADVQINNIHSCIKELISGKYKIENRMVIEGSTSKGDAFYALNDFVFHRAKNPSLVEFTVYVNDTLLNTFESDGLILATPTGSTAYSLAAGGPIMCPSVQAIVITPICPHTLSNRPIVLEPNQKIVVRYNSYKDPVEVAIDGMACLNLDPGESLELKKSKRTIKLIKLDSTNYYSTLRIKLGWTGKIRK